MGAVEERSFGVKDSHFMFSNSLIRCARARSRTLNTLRIPPVSPGRGRRVQFPDLEQAIGCTKLVFEPKLAPSDVSPLHEGGLKNRLAEGE